MADFNRKSSVPFRSLSPLSLRFVDSQESQDSMSASLGRLLDPTPGQKVFAASLSQWHGNPAGSTLYDAPAFYSARCVTSQMQIRLVKERMVHGWNRALIS